MMLNILVWNILSRAADFRLAIRCIYLYCSTHATIYGFRLSNMMGFDRICGGRFFWTAIMKWNSGGKLTWDVMAWESLQNLESSIKKTLWLRKLCCQMTAYLANLIFKLLLLALKSFHIKFDHCQKCAWNGYLSNMLASSELPSNFTMTLSFAPRNLSLSFMESAFSSCRIIDAVSSKSRWHRDQACKSSLKLCDSEYH